MKEVENRRAQGTGDAGGADIDAPSIDHHPPFTS